MEAGNGTLTCVGASCVLIVGPSPPGDYNILATDYENWAVVYSCRDQPMRVLLKTQYVWLITREKHPLPEHVYQMLNAVQTKTDYPVEQFFWTY